MCPVILNHIFLRLPLGKQHREIIYRRQADPRAVYRTKKITSKSAALYLPGGFSSISLGLRLSSCFSYFAMKYCQYLLLHISLCVPFSRTVWKEKFSQTRLMVCLHFMKLQHNSAICLVLSLHSILPLGEPYPYPYFHKMPMSLETHAIRACFRWRKNSVAALTLRKLDLSVPSYVQPSPNKKTGWW